MHTWLSTQHADSSDKKQQSYMNARLPYCIQPLEVPSRLLTQHLVFRPLLNSFTQSCINTSVAVKIMPLDTTPSYFYTFCSKGPISNT